MDTDTTATTYGQLDGRFTPAALGALLAPQGLTIDRNQSCVRVADCSHFKLELVNGIASLDADADSAEQMIQDAQLVSTALTTAGVRHRFEIQNHKDETVAYLHHDWPQERAMT